MNKTVLSLIFITACVILSANALRSILDSYSVGSIYNERKKQTDLQYLEVITKKNELDYINSPFFVEQQLRESLNYYRKGEKLLVFTQSPVTNPTTNTAQVITNPFTLWIDLLKYGIRDPMNVHP